MFWSVLFGFVLFCYFLLCNILFNFTDTLTQGKCGTGGQVCVDVNAECVSGRCTCKAGYVYVNGKCRNGKWKKRF